MDLPIKDIRVNERGDTLLHIAATKKQKGSQAVLSLILMLFGLEVNKKNYLGQNALFSAV